MTIGIGSPTPSASQTTSGSRTQDVSAKGTAQGDNTAPTSGSSKPTSQLSTLAQQLSDSALRAEERDASLDRKALGQKPMHCSARLPAKATITTELDMMPKFPTQMIQNSWSEQSRPPPLSAAEAATPLAAYRKIN
ncbi:hypothetical protein HORIV_19020 [Vreelandella olivaria]|uniref:Uncharacterized protein n=1 Tax=Vreelandella olivaria TaxID=390919 RepID=A0ABM7GFL4_9GAMM|nr:hypothetical protein HORIV_19020 [Halomonas olivaria]